MITTTSIPSLLESGLGPVTQRRKQRRDDEPSNWITKSIKRPGQLHKDLRVPQGEKIPEKRLRAGEHSKNPATRKRSIEAETLKSFHRK